MIARGIKSKVCVFVLLNLWYCDYANSDWLTSGPGEEKERQGSSAVMAEA